MNSKPHIAAVAILAFTLKCPAQQPEAPMASPAAELAVAPQSQVIVVNLLGEFNEPKRVELPKGSGLLDAVASAGGLSRNANPRKIVIIHKSPGQRPDSVKIDLLPIMQGIAKDVSLRDGDTVVIGQTLF